MGRFIIGATSTRSAALVEYLERIAAKAGARPRVVGLRQMEAHQQRPILGPIKQPH
jgi:hypothetical protein